MKKHAAKRLKEPEKKVKPNKKTEKKADKKSAKPKQGQAENEIFNFDNEIVIGVTKLPEPKKAKKTPKEKPTKQEKQKNKQVKNKPANTKQKSKENKKIKVKPEKIKEVKKAKPNKKIDLKKEKRKRRIKAFLKGVLIVTIIVGALLALMLSPLFKLEEIEIQGNAKITENEIKILSEINLEQNLFTINNNAVTNKIKSNPYIEEVKITKLLPDKISIEVKERKATYVLSHNGQYVYINNQGYILETAETAGELTEIISYKTPTEEIKLGGRLSAEDLETLGTVLKITEAANKNELSNLITSIDVANKSDIVLRIESEAKTVYLGNALDINTKMMYIKVIIDDEKGIEGDIIIENGLNSEKVIFRKKI